jgi:hypothetical protein
MPVINLSTKLDASGMGNTGAFVKTLEGQIGVGFAEGFHVHKDWMAKTIGYDTALEQIGKAEDERSDYIVDADQVKFMVGAGDKFVVEINGQQYAPTEHSFPQMSQKIGVLSSSILREMAASEPDRQDAEAMVTLAKNAIRHVKTDTKFFVRTYDDGTLRAWFSDKYAPINNRWYLETLREFLPSARLSHWKSTEDTLYGNLLLPDSMKNVPDDQDSDFGCMLSIANCEIGKRRMNLLPSIFRSICLNGNIWDQKNGVAMKRKHMGKIDLASLKTEIGESIKAQLPIAAEAIDKFLATRKLAISTNARDVLAVIASEEKLTPTQAYRAYKAHDLLESNDNNLFGIVNAITRAGQSFDAETNYQFDVLGGKLSQLSSNSWERIQAKSRSINVDDIVEIFGMAV